MANMCVGIGGGGGGGGQWIGGTGGGSSQQDMQRSVEEYARQMNVNQMINAQNQISQQIYQALPANLFGPNLLLLLLEN